MLLALIHWLADSTSLGWLRVFNYLTLRAVLAALTAFFIALALGPAVIRELRKLKVGQAVRQYGPKSHLVKVQDQCKRSQNQNTSHNRVDICRNNRKCRHDADLDSCHSDLVVRADAAAVKL